MYATYVIHRTSWLVRDAETPRERLLFHLRSGDYLATLATFLGVIEDSLQECAAKHEPPHQEHIDTLRHLRKDLSYIHNAYHLEPKDTRVS